MDVGTREEIVKIEKMAGEGAGLGRINGKVVFVPFTAPGDTVRVRIVSETKSYCMAKVLEILEASPVRVVPPCPVFGACGGCSFQHVQYERELEYKQNLVREVFRHYPEKGAVIEEIDGSRSDYGYRNKLSLKTGPAGSGFGIGFYGHKSHDLVPVERCFIARPEIGNLPGAIARAMSGLSDAGIAGSGIYGFIVHSSAASGTVTATVMHSSDSSPAVEELVRQLKASNPEISSFFSLDSGTVSSSSPNRTFQRSPAEDPDAFPEYGLKLLEGDHPSERLGGIGFEFSPASFFQVNPPVVEKIIERLKGIVDCADTKDRVLIDLYSGVGTLSLPLAVMFKEVVGIESDERCTRIAQKNAESNGIANFRHVSKDAGKALARFMKKRSDEEGLPPFLFLDPPRSGLGANVTDAVANLDFAKICYLSCNPHTQARDIDRITSSGRYRLASIHPFDMFPRTFHIECLAVLERV